MLLGKEFMSSETAFWPDDEETGTNPVEYTGEVSCIASSYGSRALKSRSVSIFASSMLRCASCIDWIVACWISCGAVCEERTDSGNGVGASCNISSGTDSGSC